MKTFFTFLLCVLTSVAFSQDTMFVHTATAANSSGHITNIDHPDLNGNPGARLAFSHVWNPPGSGGVYNDNVMGFWYNGSNWTLFNEDTTVPFVDGSSFNIYIGQGTEVIEHIASLANQGSNAGYSVVDHPSLNGNPNANAVISNYWNPAAVYNNHNYGFWYDDGIDRWIVYTEDFGDIPLDAAFFITVNGNSAAHYRHAATAGTISSNWTVLTHPLLDGNPNAAIVFSHNWGITGDPSNVVVDKKMAVWYTGTNWAIYTEDASAFPVNAEFDIIIEDQPLSVANAVITGLNYYPNPASDVFNVTASETLTAITVYDILGKIVLTQNLESNLAQIDISTLSSGQYLAKVATVDATQVIKLVKL